MRRDCFLLALLMLSLSGQMQAVPDAQGAAQDLWLSHFEGEWDLVREIRGTQAHNRVSADWILNRQFMRIHMVDTAAPPQYEAMVEIGYVPAKQKYVCYWLDSFGPALSAVGWGTRQGDSVEFTFQYDDGPFYNTFTWHESTRQWSSLMENGTKDGGRKLFARDTLSLRKSR